MSENVIKEVIFKVVKDFKNARNTNTLNAIEGILTTLELTSDFSFYFNTYGTKKVISVWTTTSGFKYTFKIMISEDSGFIQEVELTDSYKEPLSIEPIHLNWEDEL